MTLKIFRYRQGSPEWHEARQGKLSASCFGKILTSRGKPSRSAQAYLDKIIKERAGIIEVQPQSEAMARGLRLEPEARLAYSVLTDMDIEQVGLVSYDDYIVCSPDGVVMDGDKIASGLEIKCMEEKNHSSCLKQQKVPAKYIPQIQGCLWITRANYWDFFAYHPELPPYIERIKPDNEYIALLKKEVLKLRDKLQTIENGF